MTWSSTISSRNLPSSFLPFLLRREDLSECWGCLMALPQVLSAPLLFIGGRVCVCALVKQVYWCWRNSALWWRSMLHQRLTWMLWMWGRSSLLYWPSITPSFLLVSLFPGVSCSTQGGHSSWCYWVYHREGGTQAIHNTWLTHDCHMVVTWLSHGCSYITNINFFCFTDSCLGSIWPSDRG